MTTRDRIVQLAKARKTLKTSELSEKLGISRQTIAHHLKTLVRNGVLEKSGSTHNAVYQLSRARGIGPQARSKKTNLVKKIKGLEEDRLFQELDAKLRFKEEVPANVYSIVQYAITEMVNNAIDHSSSNSVRVWVQLDSDWVRFEVRDWGIGVYQNVLSKFKLKNEFEALEHVFKGKQTTMPDRHSGEGIFFTSRIADRFVLRSHRLVGKIDNVIHDTFVREERPINGTLVFFEVRRRSKKRLDALFNQFTASEYQFDRNVVRISLSEEKGLLSRSQARRLTVGLEKFNQITFDFQGVKEVGQGFADELFRVFKKRHPSIQLDYVNAVPAVKFMIHRSGK